MNPILPKQPRVRLDSLAQLVSQISPDNRYPEISTGPEVGKERVEW